jgi:hypothetical protein
MFSDVHRQLHITLKCTGKVVGKRDQTDRSPKPERAANWDPNKCEDKTYCIVLYCIWYKLTHAQYRC